MSAGTRSPKAWQIAFDTAARNDTGAVQDMLLGINAHVQNDMPFVLAHLGLRDRDGTSRKPDHDVANGALNRGYEEVVEEVRLRFDELIGLSNPAGLPADDLARPRARARVARERVAKRREAPQREGQAGAAPGREADRGPGGGDRAGDCGGWAPGLRRDARRLLRGRAERRLSPDVARSEERFARVGELDLCWQQFGEDEDPPLLMIMGLGAQMILWPDELCELIAAEGFRVIRFDNRDAGRSTVLADAPTGTVPRALAGEIPRRRLLALRHGRRRRWACWMRSGSRRLTSSARRSAG